jgi:hypothetical protein
MRKLAAVMAVGVLGAVYLFQDVNFVSLINPLLPDSWRSTDPAFTFTLNKLIRLLTNDTACMVIFFSLFSESHFRKMASYLFLLEVVVLFPLYLLVKLSLEGPTELSAPWLSQFHRLIVNPLLMLALMTGCWIQKLQPKEPG